MAFTYDSIFAVDPNNPANIAKNASITIFDPADPAQSPIAIQDPSGSPLPNPITVDAAGMSSAFQHPTLARVGWKGAGFTGYFTSYEGMFNETLAAKDAAQQAASTAGTEAVAEVAARIAAGEFKGEKGADGQNGVNGANVLPTQQAIEQALLTDGPAKTALTAAIGTVAAPAPTGVDDTAALQAVINSGASSIRLQSFGNYRVTSLTAPAREFAFEGIGSTLTATTAEPVIIKNGSNRVGFRGVNVALLSEANKVTDANGAIMRFNGQIYARAERDSDRGVLDIANFAGQGVATNRIGFLYHHYTDSNAVQFDNVGNNAALTLKNAHNPLRRPDKASNYVGDGNFLDLAVHDYALGGSRTLFFIDKNGRMTWTGATTTASTGGRARFLANKADDGQMAYFFELTNPHLNVASFSNVLDIRNDNSFTRATLKSNPAQTGGIMLESGAGPIFLTPASGSYIQLGGKLRFTSALTQTTVGAAGAGAALPATPSKYYQVTDSSGATFVIPAYASV